MVWSTETSLARLPMLSRFHGVQLPIFTVWSSTIPCQAAAVIKFFLFVVFFLSSSGFFFFSFVLLHHLSSSYLLV